MLVMMLAAFGSLQGGAPIHHAIRPAPPVEAPLARDTIALVHVNVLPMDRDRLLMRRTIIVGDGKILAMGSVDSVTIPRGIRQVDGGDTVYVLPGLADMHAHVRYESDLALLLANGITTVRNMSGKPWHLKVRQQVASGSLLGPRIYTAGPVFYGAPGSGATPEAARQLVAAQAAAGYDFIKVYDGLPRASYLAVVAEARRRGIPVAGHIPRGAGLTGVLQARQVSIEHAEQFVYHRFGDDFDAAGIPRVVRDVAASGAFVTPTLRTITTLISQWDNPDSLLRSGEVDYLQPESYAWWRTDAGHSSAYNRAMLPFLQRMTRGFRDGGVKLLAGSDFYLWGNVAGFSLHHELESLVDAGLTPYEALVTATRNPAEFLGVPGRTGTVAVGSVADLLLVAGNPALDIRRTTHRFGVVVRGRWLPGAALQGTLDSLAQQFRPERALVDRLVAGTVTLDQAALDAAPVFQESTLNQVGYALLRRKRFDAAVAVFELVTRRYPTSGGAFDSLGDGYAGAGRRTDAIRAYERALALDASQAETRRKLEALRAAP